MPEKWYALICNGVNKDRHIIYLNDIYKSWQGATVPQTMFAHTCSVFQWKHRLYVFCCALKLAAVAVGFLCSLRTLWVIHSSSMLFTYMLPGLINATHVCLSVAHWNISALLLSLRHETFQCRLRSHRIRSEDQSFMVIPFIDRIIVIFFVVYFSFSDVPFGYLTTRLREHFTRYTDELTTPFGVLTVLQQSQWSIHYLSVVGVNSQQ